MGSKSSSTRAGIKAKAAFISGLVGAFLLLVPNGISGSTSAMQESVLDIELTGQNVGSIGDRVQSETETSDTASMHAGNRCVIALDKQARDSLTVHGKSYLKADRCSIHSNSVSSSGIVVGAKAVMEGASIHSRGAFYRGGGTYRSRLVSNSSRTGDPMAGASEPFVGKCDHNNLSLKEGLHTLKPGVYCGGIIALAAYNIVLEPGIYIMKDGPFALGGIATLSGTNVGFYFQGPASVFGSGVSTKLELTAPKSGPMAGILFFEDRHAPANRDFVIRSYDAQLLEGAIYLPQGRLVIDTAGRVGQMSRWTAIVANKVELKNQSSVEVNSDHAASEIPVPEGLRSSKIVAYTTN